MSTKSDVNVYMRQLLRQVY